MIKVTVKQITEGDKIRFTIIVENFYSANDRHKITLVNVSLHEIVRNIYRCLEVIWSTTLIREIRYNEDAVENKFKTYIIIKDGQEVNDEKTNEKV